MANIKAFKGIRPRKDLVAQVVAKPFDTFYTPAAKQNLENNPISFLHTIEPLIDNPFQQGSREEIVFKKAKEFFDEFMEDGVLQSDPSESIYAYRTFNRGQWQQGIWCLTSIDDYLNNSLKKHELTRTEREKDLIEYLDNTGIDANPVLVTYQGSSKIKEILNQVMAASPDFDYHANDQQHQLWHIDSAQMIQELIAEFKKFEATYIADGHHRAAAAALAGTQKRKNNFKHHGREEYNFFSTIYFSFEELQIFEFQRVLKDLNGLSNSEFLAKLAENFEVILSDAAKPMHARDFKLYLDHTWYKISPKQVDTTLTEPLDLLDVSILQTQILHLILGITNPRRDPRISFVGGIVPIQEITKSIDAGESAAAFILFPTSIEELVAVSDAGSVMPPKSTWFEPKLPCGLVVHQL